MGGKRNGTVSMFLQLLVSKFFDAAARQYDVPYDHGPGARLG